MFGKFSWQELSKGLVQIEAQWEADNLVTLRDVDKTGLNIRLHRKIATLFEDGLAAAIKAAPHYKVRMLGGFAARHVLNDPSKPLSLHSWGIAFDVNWDRNGYGKSAPRDLPEPFVAAFENYGWSWGGKWKTPDWMHFQFATGA
jgi:hypothetical protein